MATVPDRSRRLDPAVAERAVDHLRLLVSKGLIGLAEFEEATERVLAATNEEALGQIIGSQPSLTEFTPSNRWLPVPQRVVSPMQRVRLEGRWQVARQVEVITGMGNCLLDFTNAVFDSNVTDLRINAGMSRVKILVPQWIEMVRGGAFGGVVWRLDDVPPLPGLPLVRLSVGVAMGKVIVRRPPRRRSR